MTDTLLPAFPDPATHRPHAEVLPQYLAQATALAEQGQPYVLPLTNAAAVFAAIANLDPAGPCRFRPLRVGNPAQTAWDPTPVAAYGQPGTSQVRDGVAGLLWPIYSRDMPVAKSCLGFLVALATGKPTPVLTMPKTASGLYEALRLGVVGPADAGPLDPHAVAQNTAAALVWVQRVVDDLVDGEPVAPSAPQYIVVNLAVPLTELVAKPAEHIRAPEGLQDLVGCIVERLQKLRMRGRRAGEATPASDAKPAKGAKAAAACAEWQQRAERAEAQVLQAQSHLESQARIYAEQLQQLSAGTAGVPFDVAAQYLATMLTYLRPDAPFGAMAEAMKTTHPELFAAVATAVQKAQSHG